MRGSSKGLVALFFYTDNEPSVDRKIKEAGNLLAEAFILLDESGEYSDNEAIVEWHFGISLITWRLERSIIFS